MYGTFLQWLCRFNCTCDVKEVRGTDSLLINTNNWWHNSFIIILTFKTKYMTIKESFTLHGENLLKKIRDLIAEGNIRKITISDRDGKELLSFPLTIGLVGAVFAPVFAAIGALAALIGDCSITVEREVEEPITKTESFTDTESFTNTEM